METELMETEPMETEPMETEPKIQIPLQNRTVASLHMATAQWSMQEQVVSGR